MERFIGLIPRAVFGGMIDDAVNTAALQRRENSFIHRRARLRHDVVIVEVDENEIERAVLRERELVKRSVRDLDVGILGGLPALIDFIPGIRIDGINNSLRSDHCGENRRVVTARRPNIRDFVATLYAIKSQHLLRFARGVELDFRLGPVWILERRRIIRRATACGTTAKPYNDRQQRRLVVPRESPHKSRLLSLSVV